MDKCLFLLILVDWCFNNNVNCLDFCEAEHIPKCDQGDENCLNNEMEPEIRKWMLNGQPGHFLEPLDPITFEELPLPTPNGVYKLRDVTITGFADAKFTDSNMDFVTKSIKYAYEYKFDLSAEHFVDQNGLSLLKEGPLLTHLDNLRVETKAEFVTVERCREKYVKFTKSEANVRAIKDEDVTIKSSLSDADLSLKQAIAQIAGKAATRRIAENFRTLAKLVPLSAFYN